MIRIGANPIGWSNDDMLEIGGDIPLETCLEQAQCGRVHRHGAWQQVSAHCRQTAADPGIAYGHSLVSGWYSTELLIARCRMPSCEAAQGHATLLKDMGCKVLIAAETSNAIHSNKELPLSGASGLAEGGVDRVRRALYTASHEAVQQTYGLQLVYHHHMGTVVQSGIGDRPVHGSRLAALVHLSARHGPRHLGRREIRRGWRGTTRPASAMCIARTFART